MANLSSMRRLRPWASLALLLLPSWLFGQAPALTVDEVTVGAAGQVSFNVFPSISLLPSSTPAPQQYSYATQDHKYVVVVDPGTVTASTSIFRSFSFTASARKAADPASPWYVYNVTAHPVGRFPDISANVNFSISEGSGSGGSESVGSFLLPLHSLAYDGDLIGKDVATPLTVSGSDTPAPVLQDTLDNLSIHITGVRLRHGCSSCWQDEPGKPIDLTIGPGSTQQLKLNLKPRAISAMLATAFMLNKDVPQDVLAVTVSYNVESGGFPKEKEFDFPVRFSPAAWQLALVVLLGGFCGIVLKRALDQATTRFTWTLIWRTVVVAFATELVAVLIVSFGSKLTVFGQELDPRQLTPAAILAVVATGGPTVRDWVQSLIKSWGSGGSARAAAGGGQ